MKLRYDPFVKAAYLKLRDGVAAETEEIAPDVFMDVDEDGRPIGFEFLNPADLFDVLPPSVEVVVSKRPPHTLAETEEPST